MRSFYFAHTYIVMGNSIYYELMYQYLFWNLIRRQQQTFVGKITLIFSMKTFFEII